ncbi:MULTISPECIES: DUF5658 family protein [Halorussus]|uniref:DUF5658 family protein n=1 Tax=Halorussus TaxID=1070314 RepID=UPI0020A0321A|nr:DUF5658 family protein [Halorussus vallis]USZ75779.1 DUF5658 family protein [Halorussus vallis]
MARSDANGETRDAGRDWFDGDGAFERGETVERDDRDLDEWSVGGSKDWMLRDDEFLLEEDREYVLREEGSWREYVSPALFGVVVAVMVGDVITTGVGMAMGLEEGNPLVAAVMGEVGLAGLVLLKAMAAILLVALPGVTDDARQTFRAGCAAFVAVGLVVVVTNLAAILGAA